MPIFIKEMPFDVLEWIALVVNVILAIVSIRALKYSKKAMEQSELSIKNSTEQQKLDRQPLLYINIEGKRETKHDEYFSNRSRNEDKSCINVSINNEGNGAAKNISINMSIDVPKDTISGLEYTNGKYKGTIEENGRIRRDWLISEDSLEVKRKISILGSGNSDPLVDSISNEFSALMEIEKFIEDLLFLNYYHNTSDESEKIEIPLNCIIDYEDITGIKMTTKQTFNLAKIFKIKSSGSIRIIIYTFFFEDSNNTTISIEDK